MQFTTWSPGLLLRPYVEYFYYREVSGELARSATPAARLVPAESHCHLCFTFSGRLLYYDRNQPVQVLPRAFLAGHMTYPTHLRADGDFKLLGVKFMPGRMYAFLQEPLHLFTNLVVELHALGGDWLHTLWEQLAEAEYPEQMRVRLEAALQRKLVKASAPEASVAAAVSKILDSKGTLQLQHLEPELGMSSRQLRRKFEEQVGLAPKKLASITRFHEVVTRLRKADSLQHSTLTQLALDCGYYDQAHFNHAFKEMAGLTPSQFLAQT